MTAITPGRVLREHRVNQQLSQKDVADSLNLKLSIVCALEDNDFDKVGEAIYVRGYLRSTARLLGISETDIVKLYDNMTAEHKSEVAMTSFSKRTKREASDNRLMLVTYVMIGIIIAFVVLWWRGTDINTENRVAAPSEPPVTIDNTVSDTKTQTSDLIEGATATETQEPTTTETVTAVATDSESLTAEEIDIDIEYSLQPELVPETTLNETINPKSETTIEQVETELKPKSQMIEMTSPVSQNDFQLSHTGTKKVVRRVVKRTIVVKPDETKVPASYDESGESDVVSLTALSLSFSTDCWTVIHDAKGERIAYDLMKSGKSINLAGQAPFTFLLGAPESVTLKFNGELVNLSRFKAGSTARFKLPFEDQ